MKDIRLNKLKKDAPFITKYIINGDKIEIYFSNNKKEVIPYTKKAEEKILLIMKKEAVAMSKIYTYIEEEYKSNKKNATIYSILFLINSMLFAQNASSSRKLNLFASLWCCTFAVIHCVMLSIKDKQLDEIEKWNYFLKNENIINEEIIRRFKEFYGEDANIDEANKITINDIDDYSLEDLQDMIHYIKNSDGYKLEHKRA